MIETTLKDYLEGALDGVPVYLELPEMPFHSTALPEQYVTIERIAGGKTDQIHTASFAIQSWSLNSLYEAAALDETVRDVMDDFWETENIGMVKLASNYNFTDTSTKRYRYQAVYDIVYLR